MIHVPRSAEPACLAPAFTDRRTQSLCQRRAKYYRELAEYKRGGRKEQPIRPKANHDGYARPEVRDCLRRMFGSRCAYCEGDVGSVSPQQIEHFRPAARYPALAYRWDNLLLACPHCNSTHKSDQFPVGPSGNTPHENRRSPCARTGADEDPWLLNPCEDAPEAHLTFRNGRVIYLSDRGKTTRRICRLNRDDLLQSRLNRLTDIRVFIEGYFYGDSTLRDKCVAQLRFAVSSKAYYAGMARAELQREGIDWRNL